MGGNGWKYGKGRLEVDGGRLLVEGYWMKVIGRRRIYEMKRAAGYVSRREGN